ASGEVLAGRRQVLLRREPDPAPRAAARTAKSTGTAAAELPPAATWVFEKLRAWRAAAAKEQGVPAYVILHDATLRQIAVRAPVSLAELATVSGIGESKLTRYGQQILDVLGAASGAIGSAAGSGERRGAGRAGTTVNPAQGGMMQIGVVFPQTELGGDAGAVRAYGQRVEETGFRHVL